VAEITREALEKSVQLSKQRLEDDELEKARLARLRARRKTKKTAATYREPPRGQARGPITKGPRSYLICTPCSELFTTPEEKMRVAVPKQAARSHLLAHQRGLIRRPTVPA